MSTETTENTTQPAVEAVAIDHDKVKEVLETLRPYLQGDGGDMELVEITEQGVVKLRLQGACGTCPSSMYTLKMGVEEQLRNNVPGFSHVEQVY